jgi:hypothetical protein
MMTGSPVLATRSMRFRQVALNLAALLSLLSAALRWSRAGRDVSESRTTPALQLEMGLDPLEPALRVAGEYLEPIDLRFEPGEP